MVETKEAGGPGEGLFFKKKTCRVWNRCGATALAIGEVVQFDLGAADGDTTATEYTEGDNNSIYANVIVPATGGVISVPGTAAKCVYFFGVVVDLLGGAGADNTQVEVQYSGRCSALSNVTAAIGESLTVINARRDLTNVVAVGYKVIAIAHEPCVAGTVTRVLFDGIHGFHYPAAS